jgi:hypothetical protein
VAGKKRTMLQEGEGNIILKNLEAGHAPANDVAEKATLFEYEVILFILHLGIPGLVSPARKAAE